ncbi:Dabb family protein [Marinomonas epiphytica]
MIRHILLIAFKRDAIQRDIDLSLTLFEQIQSQIPGIVSVEWGENDSPESLNKGFTHCVIMTFKNDEARQRYLPHTAHEALKEHFVPLLQDIIVFDYTL